MDIVQHIFNAFLSITEKVLDACENGVDYSKFQRDLQEEFNQLGCKICSEIPEAGDSYLLKNRSERKGWQVERRNESKEILSPFGVVRYRRTYYKGSGGYAHLIDKLAGLGPHARLDNTLKATLVERATDVSYRKSGLEPYQRATGVTVSGQAVMKAIRSFDPAKVQEKGKDKRRVRYLYIEADEDHVANQNGRTMQIKLVYVHEGKKQSGKRAQLINPYYFSGKNESVEELWFDVATYITNTYDTDAVETIFIAGDGASWIRVGRDYIPNAVYLLDRFHLCRYVLRAVRHYKDLKKSLWKAIRQKENWDGIQAYREYPAATGCSAEGHVSHILSARLSSRPRGWSRKGAETMASLCVLKANGYSVQEEYLLQKSDKVSLIKACEEAIHQQRHELKQKLCQVVRGNLPVLKGHTTYLTKALRGLSQANGF